MRTTMTRIALRRERRVADNRRQPVVKTPPAGRGYGVWISCLRKQRFSKKGARNEAMRRNQRRLPSEPELTFYACENCGRYHVGHRKES